MSILFPLIFSLIVLTVFSFLEVLLIRTLNRGWWRHKYIRRAAYSLPIWGVISIILWFIAGFYEIKWLTLVGSIAVATTMVFLLGLFLSLPISGILNSLHNWLERRKRRAEMTDPADGSADQNRRIFLKSTAAALPLITLSAGGAGVARAFQDIKIPRISMEFENLPNLLNGFKILHLSDSHLGIYKFLDDWDNVFISASEHKPDLILITGDIADDLSLLPEALKIAESYSPLYGVFMAVGNHEYYRGIKEVLRIIGAGGVPLMRDSGIEVRVGRASLYIAGADDPRVMNRDNSEFFKTTIDRALNDSPSESFRVLLSHRPEAFDYAAEKGVDLVLSGHTHGGQIGFAGRSVFETVFEGRYLWGKYKRGNSQMYLSSGIGHWFPFRLGCPPEAPILELKLKG
jgi:predicted MPP superfamily phosphohydrolase